MSDTEQRFWKHIAGGYIKLPKDLFRQERYQNVSATAKLLYGFLLDRTSLSAGKGDRWKTEEGAYYVVYTIKEIMERMHCGHDKASKLLKELSDAGLISRTRKKRSQAYHIVVHPVVSSADNQIQKKKESSTEGFGKTDANNTDTSNRCVNNTDTTTSLSRLQCEEDIQIQISYDALLDRIPQNYLDCIVSIIVDTICSENTKIQVCGQRLPAEDVRRKLMEVNEMDISYVYDRLRREKHDIQNLPGYILARLLENHLVKELYYDRWVSIDFQ